MLSIVRGQAGIGKTSILEEFSTQMGDLCEPPIIAIARCDSITRANTPYHVLGQLLPKLLENSDSNSDSKSQQNVQVGRILRVSNGLLKNFGSELLNLVLPGAGCLVSKGAKIIEKANDKESNQLVSSVLNSQDDQLSKLACIFAEISLTHPIILIIDDAHLADPISINVLLRLLSKYPKSRIMLVVGTRPSCKRTKAN